jgi:hypothetical protein
LWFCPTHILPDNGRFLSKSTIVLFFSVISLLFVIVKQRLDVCLFFYAACIFVKQILWFDKCLQTT